MSPLRNWYGSCALATFCALTGCAHFSGEPARTRLSDDFSYFEPFDNAGEIGPTYLVGPPPPPRPVTNPRMSHSVPMRSLPSIPDQSLPRSCLSCD
jgi:hypothetical protein